MRPHPRRDRTRNQLDSVLPARDGWLALDTETTGRGDGAEIVEIAVVAADGTVLFDSLIRPTRPISKDAVKLHGITAEHLRGAPRFAAVYEDLRTLIAGRDLVAYHAPFDRRVLETSCALSGKANIPARWICALDCYESLRGFRPPLHIACEIERVGSPARRHRAVADALALQRLIASLRNV